MVFLSLFEEDKELEDRLFLYVLNFVELKVITDDRLYCRQDYLTIASQHTNTVLDGIKLFTFFPKKTISRIIYPKFEYLLLTL